MASKLKIKIDRENRGKARDWVDKLKLKKKTSEEISKVTGGIALPPGFKLPF